MSSPLARSLFRELTNWRPRYTKEAKLQKCKKCKHAYIDHSIFPTFTNLFLDANGDDPGQDNNSNYSFCSLCNCGGFVD